MVVCDDALASVDVYALQSNLRKSRCDHDRRQALAEADDEVIGARSELAQRGDALKQLVERVEVVVERSVQGSEAVARCQLRRSIEVPTAQAGSDFTLVESNEDVLSPAPCMFRESMEEPSVER